MLNTYGVLAAASISMILYGLIKHRKDTRANTNIWKFLDGGAEAISLTLAGSLLSLSDRTGNAIGLLLVLASLGIGYGHYQKLTNKHPEWNYIDGGQHSTLVHGGSRTAGVMNNDFHMETIVHL